MEIDGLPIIIIYIIYLVGGIPTPLKNMKVSWDDYSHILWKIKNVPNHQPEYKSRFEKSSLKGMIDQLE